MNNNVTFFLPFLMYLSAFSQLHPAAAFQISSTTQGFLLPQMTQAQIDNINNPVNGLIVYYTEKNNVNTCNGTEWTAPGGSGLRPSTLPIGMSTIGPSQRSIAPIRGLCFSATAMPPSTSTLSRIVLASVVLRINPPVLPFWLCFT